MDEKRISIHDAAPLEIGGVEARQGFSFQDHVAVGFLLDLLEDKNLKEVWCESHDDITLIWDGNEESVEFVQVKAADLNQLWSIAELTKQEKKQTKNGEVRKPSILERSLEYDRYAEPSHFRIVTSRPPNDDLKALTAPLRSMQRQRAKEKLVALKSILKQRMPEAISPNGNTTDFWIDNTVWDTRHDMSHVEQSNLLRLRKIVERFGEFLATDQIEEFYSKLLATAKTAAEAEWGETGEHKKFEKTAFARRFASNLQRVAHPGQQTAGTNLTDKLTRADLEKELDTANSLRRRYRESVLQPKYQSHPDRHIVEGEIEALLHRLRSDLDTGKIPDDGPAFHASCLAAIATARTTLERSQNVNEVPLDSWMLGFMYNLTDRCPHRFRRIAT